MEVPNLYVANVGFHEEVPPPLEIGLNTEQRQQVIRHFFLLALSDFHHDFGESFVNTILNNVFLDSTVSTSKNAANAAKIRSLIPGKIEAKKTRGSKESKSRYRGKNALNWSLYEELAQYMPQILPGGAGINTDEIWKDEESVLKNYNINFTRIKNILRTRPAEGIREMISLGENLNFTIPNNSEGVEPIHIRKYSIKAIPYKVDGVFSPFAVLFEKLTGKQKFAFVYDASFLPITALAKTQNGTLDAKDDEDVNMSDEVAVPEGTEYTFRILANLENDSDSAGKTVKFKRYTDTPVEIEVYKDEGQTSSFPVFNSEAQNGNFFSNIDFITARTADGKVKGTFTLNPEEEDEDEKINVIVDDLGNESEISRAETQTILKYLENYRQFQGGDINSIREVLLPLLEKRAGDWCQGLSLFDKLRTYKSKAIFPRTADVEGGGRAQVGGAVGDSMNLKQMEDDGTAIGVLTHDQILLAYCILIGVNVFFTLPSANPSGGIDGPRVAWLLYFENEKSAVDAKLPDGVGAAMAAELETLQARVSTSRTNYSEKRGILIKLIKEKYLSGAEVGLVDFIGELKSCLDTLNEFYPFSNRAIGEIDTLKIELLGGEAKRSTLLKANIVKKNVETLLSRNETLLNKIEINPLGGATVALNLNNFTEIELIFNEIKDGKSIGTLNIYKQFLTGILQPIREGIKNVLIELNKGPVGAVQFKALPPRLRDLVSFFLASKGGRRISNLTENVKRLERDIEEVFKTANLFAQGAPQTGGAVFQRVPKDFRKQVNLSFESLLANQIVPWSIEGRNYNAFRDVIGLDARYVEMGEEEAGDNMGKNGAGMRLGGDEGAAAAKNGNNESVVNMGENGSGAARAARAAAAEKNGFNGEGYAGNDESNFIEHDTEIYKRYEMLEHFLAPKYGYVLDTDGYYYSVIDEFLVTKADCWKFISLYGEECMLLDQENWSELLLKLRDIDFANARDMARKEADLIDAEDDELNFQERLRKYTKTEVLNGLKQTLNESYLDKFDYLSIRYLLLCHDILYTKFQKIRTMNWHLLNETNILDEFLDSVFYIKGILVMNYREHPEIDIPDYHHNYDNILLGVMEYLAGLREILFSLYYDVFQFHINLNFTPPFPVQYGNTIVKSILLKNGRSDDVDKMENEDKIIILKESIEQDREKTNKILENEINTFVRIFNFRKMRREFTSEFDFEREVLEELHTHEMDNQEYIDELQELNQENMRVELEGASGVKAGNGEDEEEAANGEDGGVNGGMDLLSQAGSPPRVRRKQVAPPTLESSQLAGYENSSGSEFSLAAAYPAEVTLEPAPGSAAAAALAAMRARAAAAGDFSEFGMGGGRAAIPASSSRTNENALRFRVSRRSHPHRRTHKLRKSKKRKTRAAKKN